MCALFSWSVIRELRSRVRSRMEGAMTVGVKHLITLIRNEVDEILTEK